jgi:hypothetical protein
MSITFSTAWYIFKSKFDPSIYKKWMDNMLSNVNEYYLVVYTDVDGFHYIRPYLSNPRIKVVFKSYDEFYTYKYKDDWISNHEKNHYLNKRIDWQLNMLWCEKINFVSETMKKNYFKTEYFGWCDIGYFRGNSNDLPCDVLSKWPSNHKVSALKHDKVYYACVNNDNQYLCELYTIINDKNEIGLPKMEIPQHQVSIAGGFFISHSSKLEWWRKTFYDKLDLYLKNDYLIKDDQIIIADCVFSDVDNFELIEEESSEYDNWFLFQRFLL